jgi:PKD repeat protein
LSYEWDFGEGPLSGGLIASHVYTEDRTYTVVFTATDECGFEQTTTTMVTVNPPDLVAGFDQSTTEPVVDTTVYFTDSSTTDGPEIVAWWWDFDDGETATTEDPSKVYDELGTYTVTHVVTDALGYSDEVSKTITVVPACTALSSADFVYLPEEPVVQSPVEFTASYAPLDATEPITYEWDFGDGETAEVISASVQHTYTSSGTKAVQVTVYNPCTPLGVSSDPKDVDVAPMRVFLPLVVRNK